MNWDHIAGNWKEFNGHIKQQWGKLTDDDLDEIAGKRDVLAGKLQASYGVTKEEAHQQLSDWEIMLGNLAKTDKEVTDGTVRTQHPNDED